MDLSLQILFCICVSKCVCKKEKKKTVSNCPIIFNMLFSLKCVKIIFQDLNIFSPLQLRTLSHTCSSV